MAIELLLADAYRLLPRLECTFPFPLLIIGGEALTDERRTVMLDFIQRMIVSLTSGGRAAAAGSLIGQVVNLLELLWVQDDLHDDRERYLDYRAKLHWAITSWDVLPALV